MRRIGLLIFLAAYSGYAEAWISATAPLSNKKGSGSRQFCLLPRMRRTRPHARTHMVTSSSDIVVWDALGGGATGQGVRKLVLEQGLGKQAEFGSQVEVEFVGTFAELEWSVDDVIECWLEVRLRRCTTF